jgi:hypothetical protein
MRRQNVHDERNARGTDRDRQPDCRRLLGADGRPTVVDGTPLGADMSGRTLNRAAAIESVVAAPPGLGRETRAGCGAAGVRQLEAPLM